MWREQISAGKVIELNKNDMIIQLDIIHLVLGLNTLTKDYFVQCLPKPWYIQYKTGIKVRMIDI